MNKVREVRVVKRISQFRLGYSTGIHQSRISLIENGLIEARDDEKEKLAESSWGPGRRGCFRGLDDQVPAKKSRRDKPY